MQHYRGFHRDLWRLFWFPSLRKNASEETLKRFEAKFDRCQRLEDKSEQIEVEIKERQAALMKEMEEGIKEREAAFIKELASRCDAGDDATRMEMVEAKINEIETIHRSLFSTP